MTRSVVSVAALVGGLGGAALAGYALFMQAMTGLGHAAGGPDGSGAEDRLNALDAHYQHLLYVGLMLLVMAVAAAVVLRRSRKRG